jgi:hypothetical protein
VVTVPAGEDTQEGQQLPHNDDHNNDHGEEENDEEKNKRATSLKDEMFCDADEIKTIGNEASIPIGRPRDLLNYVNITTQLEFRTKRVPHAGREEYKAVVEIFSGPNVLSRHEGLAFRDMYQMQ